MKPGTLHSVLSAVRGQGLSQQYGRLRVFQNLSVDLGPSVTALLGPNGAGKTTLLHTLVGLRRPASGELSVLGYDMLSRGGRRAVATQLGFLPQVVAYYSGYTVWDFVAYAAWLKKVPESQIHAKVAAALDDVDLAAQARTRMGRLSGGMLRRAGIAQAIVHQPTVLLLDEPAAGLDPAQRMAMRKLVTRLGKAATVLVSTHVVEDVRLFANRVLILNSGTIVFDGAVSALASLGKGGHDGESELEQGYLATLHADAGVEG